MGGAGCAATCALFNPWLPLPSLVLLPAALDGFMAVIYSKGWGGLHLLLRAYGSAIPRTLLASILSTALAAFLFCIPGKNYFQG